MTAKGKKSQELAKRDKIIAELQKALNEKSQIENHSYQSLIQQKDQAINHLKKENLIQNQHQV